MTVVRVVGCTGHRHIPPAARREVLLGVRRVVEELAGSELVGTCSLAVGADQVFADAVLDVGGRLHAVIPAAGYAETFDGDERAAYEALLARAASVETLPFTHPSDDAYLAAGRRVAELADVLVAVWDGEAARGRGGTGEVVGLARAAGVPVVVVWPTGTRRPADAG